VELFGDNHRPLQPAKALRLRSQEIQFLPVVVQRELLDSVRITERC
jgi:hypothetical protein